MSKSDGKSYVSNVTRLFRDDVDAGKEENSSFTNSNLA